MEIAGEIRTAKLVKREMNKDKYRKIMNKNYRDFLIEKLKKRN